MSWKRIDDEQVRHTWECPECGKTVIVGPEFYQVNGTPVCSDCSEDMIYCWTEIKSNEKSDRIPLDQ